MANEKTPEQIKKEQEEAAKKHKEEQAKRDADEREKNKQPQHPDPTKPKSAKKPNVSAAVSTYNKTRSESDPLLGDPRGDTFFTPDEIKGLAGDIIPGELAILKLDEEGHPQGTALRDDAIQEARNNPGESYTTVIAPAYSRFDEIVTPSGAPISKFMNPDPVLWDAGMLARNPPPPIDKDKPPGPIGGGVVNQPVRV